MKKICCAILAVLCILPCLAGCGKKDKYIEYRITLSDDLTQPGTITMQFYDYYFDMEKVSIEDVQTGEIETNYYATGTFLSDTNLANLPVLIHFNGDVLTLDGTMVAAASPIMLMLDFSEGKTHEIGLEFDGLTRVFVASASCS